MKSSQVTSSGGSKLDISVGLDFARELLTFCSKWRNNDKRDGYLNWSDRAIKSVGEDGGNKSRLAAIHD